MTRGRVVLRRSMRSNVLALSGRPDATPAWRFAGRRPVRSNAWLDRSCEVAERKRTAAKPTKNEQHTLGNAEMAESFEGAVDKPLLKR